MAASPGSDNNCNIYMPPIGICSVASSHDFSDYQWLSDFGSYRDGAPTHQSILSALSASYNGIGELSYYEKMAKDIDANLAEIDMESFRTEDMHSLLTGLPPAGQQRLLVDDVERKARNNNRIFSTANGGCTGTGLITVDMMDNSICKSELLFSPVKESHISVDSLDMDGYPDEEDIILTCQANKNNYTIAFEQSVLYSDESFYADGPENYGKYKRMNLLNNLQSCGRFFKNRESAMSHSEVGYTTWSKVKRNGPAQRVPVAINPLISHISRHARTCFVRKSLSMPNLQENQISQNQSPTHHALPNGQQPLNVSQAAATGAGPVATETFDRPLRTLLPMYTLPTDSENESTNNEGCGGDGEGRDPSHDRCDQSGQLHEEDQQHQQHHQQQHQQQQQPSFNLVKLFIKQKSSSTDTCMDVSSGCWPSDSTNESGGSTGDHQHHPHQSQQRLGGRIKKNSMNDSGKCSSTMLGGPNALDNDEDDRDEDEEEFQLDSLDAQINNLNNNAAGNEDAAPGAISAARRAAAAGGPLAQAKLNDFNRQMPCSPRRQYKGYNMNIGGRKGMGGKILPSTIHSSGSSGMASSPQSSINSSSGHHHNHNQSNHGNNVNNNNSYKDTNSDASRTSENLTQIFNHSGNNNTTTTTTRHSTKTVPLEMITKSMQTSLTVSGAPGAIGTEKVRVIPPSFLDRLNELGDRQKAPVFVVYPNYVLPDLGFLKPQSNEVVLSPLSFRETMSTAGTGKGAALLGATRKARPVSLNDIETIKQREYRHVADWKSLVFLLPTDYRKLLRHIPEVSELALSTESRPMFCQTPPLRRTGGGVGGGRGTIACDCMTLLQQNTQTYASSSSGGSSSAAPSSGYRGSSTMLTTGDSEMDLLGPSNANGGGAGAGNGLYVYQYDSPAEVLGSFDRPPSGRLGSAGPKSILRRPKAKRNSMFEEEPAIGTADHHAPSSASMGVREKRRSLQEHHSYNFYEEEEAERSEQKLHNSPNMTPHPRLANTPKLPSADHYHKLNKLVELSERELMAAGGGDGPAAAAHGGHPTEDELEARARAEHFLSHVPRAELKHYAEIAHILESTEGIGADAGGGETGATEEAYDRTRLRNEVSRALSQRRNVTFTPASAPHAVAKGTPTNTTTPDRRQAPGSSSPASALLRPTDIKFSTPPNSPNNMSVMAAHGGSTKVAEKKPPMAQQRNGVSCTEKEKQNKIETNRFKRLQIQWELLSKEAHGRAAAESQRRMEIRSGGNTPTGGNGSINGANKSRIPRPVSYPTTRTNSDPVVSKTLKSPSRIAPPRRYPGVQSPQTHGTTTATTPPTPAPRTPSRTYGNITTTTPKKVSSVPSRIPLVNRGRKVAIK
uniref:Putative transcription factor mef2a n=1 Tax=Anopheles triannulatus TaxID=58253 RepID=A0A2M4A781_9DIPT